MKKSSGPLNATQNWKVLRMESSAAADAAIRVQGPMLWRKVVPRGEYASYHVRRGLRSMGPMSCKSPRLAAHIVFAMQRSTMLAKGSTLDR